MCAAVVRRVAAQVETGSAITWKYPSVVLRGDNSVGEFYSVALTNNHQQARSCACMRAVRETSHNLDNHDPFPFVLGTMQHQQHSSSGTIKGPS